MSDERKLSALTRSLILSASVGTLALSGCVTQEQAEVQVAAAVDTLPRSEGALCQRAVDSKSARDVNLFLRRHPESSCVAPLLSAMPAATLAALSPSAVAGVPQSTINRLPQRVTSNLPATTQGRTPRAPQGQPSRGNVRAVVDSGNY